MSLLRSTLRCNGITMSLQQSSIETSRAKRIERQQARFRDRGGYVASSMHIVAFTLNLATSIFKPSEHNPLLDLLLSRGVNGESPSRGNSQRRSRSRSASPSRKPSGGHEVTTDPRPPTASSSSKAKPAKRKKPTKGRNKPVAEGSATEPVVAVSSRSAGTSLYIAVTFLPPYGPRSQNRRGCHHVRG